MQTWQLKEDDCGAAALSTLLEIPYHQIEKAWIAALNETTGPSNYYDLITVANYLGYRLVRCGWRQSANNKRIVRARVEYGTSHSHWIVMNEDDSIWCPWSGYHSSISDYIMPCLSRALRIEIK